MQKSFTKRIRITKTGKLLRRSMGTDHFRTRKSTKNLRQKKNQRSLNYPRKAMYSAMYTIH